MPAIISLLNAINTGINYIAAVLFIFSLAFLVIYYTIKRIESYVKKGEGPAKGFFLGVIALIEAILFAYIIIQFPVVVEKGVQGRLHWNVHAQVIRWVFLYLTVPLIAYYMTRKNSRLRGLFVTEVILTIGLVGWTFERWLGVLFIAVPIYTILAYLVYRLAQVILPSSDPGDMHERMPKFKALLFYILGIQYPVWAARSNAARDFDTRIPGDPYSGYAEPGIVWTYSHQVAGISGGVQFDKVEGPGIIFTRSHTRPIALVDLRTQTRKTDLDATTRDGITFRASLVSVFAIDRENWPKKNWTHADTMQMTQAFKKNPTLAKGMRVDRRIGSYWYSTARVKSVLSTAGFDPRPAPDGNIGPVVYWDEWVVKQTENAARQVLSQRTVDELWRPVDNQAGTSALDEIAVKIRAIAEPELRAVGVNLLSCRVIDFAFDEKSPIRQQQIDSWKTIWDQRITAALSDAAAIRQEEIEKAHAYAKSEILDAIATSIEKARLEHPDLPRHVIALYFIHALEEVVQKEPASASQETKDRLDILRHLLATNNE